MKKRLLALVAALTLAGMTGAAHAGQVGDSAYCSKNADGSGYCYGTFAGFRNTSNYNDFAEFYSPPLGNSTASFSFYASFNGVWCSCTASASTTPAWLLTTALTAHSYFSISWDSNAACTLTNFINASWSTTK